MGHIRSSKMRENSSDGTSCGGLSQKHVGNEAKWHAQKARKMAEAAQVDGAQMLRWLGPQVGVIVDVCDEFGLFSKLSNRGGGESKYFFF